MKKEICTAVILAAGQGKRMHTDVRKQYLDLCGYPVIYYAIRAFEESPVDSIVLVTGEEEIDYCKNEIVEKYNFRKVKGIVSGGRERYHSVYEGLKAAAGADYVLIHDGARPFVTREIIERTLEGAKDSGACVAGMPAKDTVKISGTNGFAEVTPQRDKVWMIQTPQTFAYNLIFDAYHKLIELEKSGHTESITDDAMVLEIMCHKYARLVEGAYENIKITTPSDLKIAELFCRDMCSFMQA